MLLLLFVYSFVFSHAGVLQFHLFSLAVLPRIIIWFALDRGYELHNIRHYKSCMCLMGKYTMA